jgi:hypothetical protein
LKWLLGKHSQAEITGTRTGRSLRRSTSWCWNVAPEILVTGEIYDQVQVDGIYLGSWCCLIARTPKHIIGWQWCDTEKKAAWAALLARFPAPRVVISDGGSGLAAAVRECWPETRMQRCVVHVQRNVRVYLTNNPRTDAGRALLRLSRALSPIRTEEHAAAWTGQLAQWHAGYGALIKKRTYRGAGVAAPSWVKPGQKWWFTHKRLRSAYFLLEKLVKNGTLFTYVEQAHRELGIEPTTNRLEGGTNTGIRGVLRHHRGMSEEHMKRAVEWFLYTRSETPQPSWKLIRPEHHSPAQRKKRAPVEEQIGPEELGTSLSSDEGLWLRSGWAGRP